MTYPNQTTNGHPTTAEAPAHYFADPDMIRDMLFQVADCEVCVATFERRTGEIHLQSRYPLKGADIKKIRGVIFKRALESGWQIAPEDTLRVFINAKPADSIIPPRDKHELKTFLTHLISIPGQEPFILCVCRFDRELEENFRFTLDFLAADPEKGLIKLWRRILRQRQDFELLLTNVIDGVILCDDEQRILFINERARKLTGMPALPKRGSKLSATAQCDLPALLNELTEKKICQLNRVIRLGGSSAHLMGVRIQHLQGLAGEAVGWLLVLRDISASWHADQMRSTISMTSHELNTPLTAIKSSIDLLLEEKIGGLNENQKKVLGIVEDDIRHMQRLLRDLLDSSRLEEGKIELDRRKFVRIEFIFSRVMESYALHAETRGITLKAKVMPGISDFQADRDRITQILMNLVDNAIKFSPMGGEVVLHAEEKEDTLVVTVQDQGSGIPEDQQERIFERFVQFAPAAEGQRGFGLGLSIARDIVHSHGGTIGVRSRPGEGSSFYFTIPKKKEEAHG